MVRKGIHRMVGNVGHSPEAFRRKVGEREFIVFLAFLDARLRGHDEEGEGDGEMALTNYPTLVG